MHVVLLGVERILQIIQECGCNFVILEVHARRSGVGGEWIVHGNGRNPSGALPQFLGALKVGTKGSRK